MANLFDSTIAQPDAYDPTKQVGNVFQKVDPNYKPDGAVAKDTAENLFNQSALGQAATQFQVPAATPQQADVSPVPATSAEIQKDITNTTGIPETPKQDASNTTGSTIYGAITGAGGQGVGQALSGNEQTQSAMGVKEYNTDLAKFGEEEKSYLNPNTDIRPDLEAYLKRQPSAVDTTYKSDLFASSEKSNYSDPVGVAVGQNHQLSYIYGQYQEGALNGLLSGGWEGAIVGAVVGLIKGICNWNNAESQDSKVKAQALSDYLQSVKAWNLRQKQRASASFASSVDAAKGQEADTEKKQETASNTKKAVMLKLINSMGSNADSTSAFAMPGSRRG